MLRNRALERADLIPVSIKRPSKWKRARKIGRQKRNTGKEVKMSSVAPTSLQAFSEI